MPAHGARPALPARPPHSPTSRSRACPAPPSATRQQGGLPLGSALLPAVPASCQAPASRDDGGGRSGGAGWRGCRHRHRHQLPALGRQPPGRRAWHSARSPSRAAAALLRGPLPGLCARLVERDQEPPALWAPPAGRAVPEGSGARGARGRPVASCHARRELRFGSEVPIRRESAVPCLSGS